MRSFLEAVEDELIAPGSYLLVESLDRITRADILTAQSLFLEIINAGITLVTLVDRRSYSKESVTANPIDLILSILTMMRAHEESAVKGARVRAAWEAKRKNASQIPLTARAPAWLELDRTVSPPKWRVLGKRANTVRRIYRMAAKGVGQHSIAATLNKEQVPTFGTSKFWHRSYIKKILDNEAVIGVYIPHTSTYDAAGRRVRSPQEPVADYYPAIIGKELFENVRAMRLEGNRQPSTKGSRPAHMLAGLAKCGRCGETMTRVFKGRGNGKPMLVCTVAKVGSGCTYDPVRVEDVEDAIRREAGYLVATAPTGDDDLDRQWLNVETSIGMAQEMIGNVVDAIAKKGRSAALEKRLDELELALREEMKRRDVLGDKIVAASRQSVAKRFDSLLSLIDSNADPAEINAVLRQLAHTVTVDRASGRLTFEWSHGGLSDLVFAWPTEDYP